MPPGGLHPALQAPAWAEAPQTAPQHPGVWSGHFESRLQVSQFTTFDPKAGESPVWITSKCFYPALHITSKLFE